jgi:hypothetical protein
MILYDEDGKVYEAYLIHRAFLMRDTGNNNFNENQNA